MDTTYESYRMYYNEYKDSIIAIRYGSQYRYDTLYFILNEDTKIWNEYDCIKSHFIKYLKKNKRIINYKSINELFKYYDSFYNRDRDISIFYKQLYCIFTTNGAIDIRSGNIRDITIDDYTTIAINRNWLGINGNTDTIDNYFMDIMLGDTVQIQKLQKCLGECLFREKIDLVIRGPDESGKSTLFNLIEKTLDKYTVIIYNLGYKREYLNRFEDQRKICLIQLNYSEVRCNDIHKVRYMDDIPHIFFMNTKDVWFDSYDDKIVIDLKAQFKSKNKFDVNNNTHILRDTNICEKLDPDQFLLWLVKGSIMYYREKYGYHIAKNANDS